MCLVFEGLLFVASVVGGVAVVFAWSVGTEGHYWHMGYHQLSVYALCVCVCVCVCVCYGRIRTSWLAVTYIVLRTD